MIIHTPMTYLECNSLMFLEHLNNQLQELKHSM